MLRRFIFLFILVTFFSPGNAQYYSGGESPSSIRWLQVNNDSFRLIFPESFSKQAVSFLNYLEYSSSFTSDYYNISPRKLKVILHNHSVNSNGFVALAPRRMELVTTPPQNIYPQPWMHQLALHEYRHVAQLSKLNRGVTRFLSYLLGQQGPGLISAMIPRWLYEGDAVISETAYSYAGRGRQPFFKKQYKALVLEKDTLYPFIKAIFGSYKDFVPNHYELGYFMSSYGRMKYDKQIWERVFHTTGHYPFLIIPNYFSLKWNYKTTKTRIYHSTFEYLEKEWRDEEKEFPDDFFNELVSNKDKVYTSYRSPVNLNQNYLLAQKSGLDITRRFVIINKKTREEFVLYKPGTLLYDHMSFAKGKLVWSENIPGTRWPRRSYSDIKLMDIETGKVRFITRRGRYFAPAISNDGSKIAAIRVTLDNQYFIDILDAFNGTIHTSFPTPSNVFVQFPSWSNDDGQLVMTGVSEEGKNILMLDVEAGNWREILPFFYEDISKTVFLDDQHVLYSASYSGIDNIFALNIKENNIFQVTFSRFGAYEPQPFAGGDSLLFSYYTANGYKLASAGFNFSSWRPFKFERKNETGLLETITRQENPVLQNDSIPTREYEVKPYRKWLNVFNIHSWIPIAIDTDDLMNFNFGEIPVYPGFSLLSQNHLSSVISTMGYAYKNGYHTVNGHFTIRSFYPVLDLAFDIGGPAETISPSYDGIFLEEKISKHLTGKIFVPLNLTRNRFIRNLTPAVTATYQNTQVYDSMGFKGQGVLLLSNDIFFRNVLRLARRDIYPRWGQIVNLRSIHSPIFNDDLYGYAYTGRINLFFPGLLRNHSLLLRAGFQAQFSDSLYFNDFIIQRGFDQKKAKDIYLFSSDYVMPLFYPDWELWLMYIKRFRAGLFYDFAQVHDQEIMNRHSLGAEVLMDYHLLRIIMPFSTGARFVYIPSENRSQVELIFSLNISGF